MSILPSPIFDMYKGINADLLIPELAKLYGFPTEIYYPVLEDSIYTQEDNYFVYSDTPQIYQDLLIVGRGIISTRFISDRTLDMYNTDEVSLLTVNAMRVDPNSKVIVHITNVDVLTLRVYDEPTTMQGNDTPMYRKYKLVPMEVRV